MTEEQLNKILGITKKEQKEFEKEVDIREFDYIARKYGFYEDEIYSERM